MIANLLRHNFVHRFDLQQTNPIFDQQSLWWWSRKKQDEVEPTDEEESESELDRVGPMTYEELVEQIETPLYDRGDSEKERLSDGLMVDWMLQIPLQADQAGWDQSFPVLAIPMTLTQYVDCFWADQAPYFIPALLTKDDD